MATAPFILGGLAKTVAEAGERLPRVRIDVPLCLLSSFLIRPITCLGRNGPLILECRFMGRTGVLLA